jgi:hypothetical protein
MILEPGARVGPYRIVQRLGRGATGVVYRATHPEYGDVALKVMAADLAEEESTRTRFVREAHTLVRLRHRNIVTVLEGGVHEDLPYIAMELLGGSTLAARMASAETISLERKLDIVIQLCEGLQFAHEHGVVHRDVKPANVWILSNGGVKLLDFGTARVLGSTHTRRRDLVGSAAYMAPEQLVGSDVDGRADVFAAGAILYELLAGRRLFDAESIGAVMNKILHGPPPTIALAGVPTEIVRALETALQKDVARRYQEAGEFGSDLMLARYGLGHETIASASAQTGRPAPVAEPTVILPRAGRPAHDGASGADDGVETEVATLAIEPGPSVVRDGESGAARSAPMAAAIVEHLAILRQQVARQLDRGARLYRDAQPRLTQQASAVGASTALLLRRLAPYWPAVALVTVAAIALTVFLLLPDPVTAPPVEIAIASVPPGAAIAVDGVPTGRQTPATLQFAERPERLGLALAGYEPVEAVVPEGPASVRTSLSYTLRRLVRVESRPSGARILIDGADSGLSTPADVPMATGSLPVLTLQSSDRSSATVQVTEALFDAGSVHVALARPRGRTDDVRQAGGTGSQKPPEPSTGSAPAPVPPPLAATTPVDVHAAGLYPFELSGCGASSPPASRHDLQVQAPCTLRLRAPRYHLDQTRRVNAQGGRVEITAPPLARVQLRSKYEACTVLLNDQAVGSPPVDLELAAGTYRVLVQCSDRTYSIRALTIEPGQSSRRLDDLLQ